MNKTVTLKKPLLSGKVTEFVFRDPTFEDFCTYGYPAIDIGGSTTIVPTIVKDYAERLLVGGDVSILAYASLADAMQIQAVILSFFSDAIPSDPPSTKSDVSPESLLSADKPDQPASIA